MARVKRKVKNVAKFGGVDQLGNVNLEGFDHDTSSVEAKSQTNLEQDKGEGNAVVLRCFTFGINPEVFLKQKPSKQELFNYHIGSIEQHLWRDGLAVVVDVPPRLVFNTKKMQYQIFVTARPRKGHMLLERPQTLSQIAQN